MNKLTRRYHFTLVTTPEELRGWANHLEKQRSAVELGQALASPISIYGEDYDLSLCLPHARGAPYASIVSASNAARRLAA